MRHVQQRGHLDEVRSNLVCFVLRRQTRTQAKKHACAHVSLAGTPVVCWSTQLFSGVLDLNCNVWCCCFSLIVLWLCSSNWCTRVVRRIPHRLTCIVWNQSVRASRDIYMWTTLRRTRVICLPIRAFLHVRATASINCLATCAGAP